MNWINGIIKKYKGVSEVFKASIWFIAVSIIDKAISIFTQPFINRSLSTEQIGVYGVYSSWHSILSILVTFNLFCGVLEVYLTKNEEDKDNVSCSLNILSLLISFLFLGLFIVFKSPISTFINLKSSYIFIMMITIMGEAMIQFWAVPKRFQYSYKIYAVVTVGLFAVKSVASVALTFFFEKDRILGRLLGLGFPTVVCGIVLFIITLKKANFKSITKYWLPALRFNIPLIPHYLAAVLLSSSDKIMIDKLSSSFDSGLYTIAYTYSSLSLIVFSALNGAYNPYAMKCLKDDQIESLSKTTHSMITVSILFSVLMIYLAPEGIFILGGEKYLEALPIVPVLIIGIYFSSFYYIFSNVEFVYEKTKVIFPITLIGALINIATNYFLIPELGYEAASYTTFAGYLFIAVAHCYYSYRILKKDIYNIKKILLKVLLFIVFAMLGIVLYKSPMIVRCFAMLLVVVCLLFEMRKIIPALASNTKTNERKEGADR